LPDAIAVIANGFVFIFEIVPKHLFRIFRPRLFEAASVGVFSFQQLNRRRQTRLGQGAKRVNGILGGAVCSAR
jgi:hypothetical protein